MTNGRDLSYKMRMSSTIIAVVTGLVAVIAGLVTYTQKPPMQLVERLIPSLEEYERGLKTIAVRIDKLEEHVGTLTSIPVSSPVAPRFAAIEKELQSIKANLGSINSVILESPQKALELPLIKRDIDSLKGEYRASLSSLEREISRNYEFMRWVVGSILLGILGLSVSVFLSVRSRKE